jgi:hypothetical protein
MQPTFSFPKKSLSLVFVCAFLTACSSMLGAEDDESIYGSVKLPPRVSEANARKGPVVIPLKNSEPPVSLSNPAPAVEPLAVPKPASLEVTQPAPDTVVAKVAPAAPPKAVLPPPDETAAAAPMLFAPYISTLREGELPRRWQKQPSYDFPWIPGAIPTRTNEETVVGYGEQMLGRLYAHASFADRTSPAPAITESVQVKPLPPAKDKKAGKNAKNTEPPAEPTPAPVVEKTVSNKKLLQCEGGATCLDAARDVLVEDAKSKGWEMLLSRRVSLHNSFQFSRGERVIWVELNSNGKRDMDIEYTLLPLQAKDNKK